MADLFMSLAGTDGALYWKLREERLAKEAEEKDGDRRRLDAVGGELPGSDPDGAGGSE